MIQRRQSRPTHVVVEAQGHFVRLSCKGADAIGGGKRKTVNTFSRASRKRLLETLLRIDPQYSQFQASFITLTYPEAFPDAATAKQHLFTFWKRVRRAFPRASAIWRLEFQKRGAPHFHLIYFGPYFGKGYVQQWWGEVIGFGRPFTRIEGLQSWRHALAYATKYMAKVPEVPVEGAVAAGTAEGGCGAARDSGLNYVTYLTGKSGTGRVWRVLDRKNLPWGEAQEVELPVGYGRWVHRWKRAARHEWKGVSGKEWHGASLFREHPEAWVKLAVIEQEREARNPQGRRVRKPRREVPVIRRDREMVREAIRRGKARRRSGWAGETLLLWTPEG